MLLSYRKMGWAQATIGVALLAAVSVATFTRAATEKPAAAEATRQEAGAPPQGNASIESLQAEIEKLMEQRRDLESRWNAVVRESGGPEASAIQHIEGQRIATVGKRVEAEATLRSLLPLIDQGRAEEVQNAYPEARLTDLLQSVEQTEVELKTRSADFGSKHPEVHRLEVRLSVIQKQLASRLAGVKSGLNIRIETYQQVENQLAELLVEMKQKEAQQSANREVFDRERSMLEQKLNLLRLRQEAFVKARSNERQ